MMEWVKTPGSHRKVIFALGILGALGGAVFGATRAWDRIAAPAVAPRAAAMPTLDQVEALVAAVEHGNPEAEELIARSAPNAGVSPTVLRRFLAALAKRPYRGVQMGFDLITMATVYRQLDTTIAGPSPDATETTNARTRLRTAWNEGDQEAVRDLLQARQDRLEAALADAQRQGSKPMDVAARQRSVSDTALNLGRLALIGTGHPAAARHIRTAALSLPPGDSLRRAALLVLAADSFTVAGLHGEGVPALDEAIALASDAAKSLSSSVRDNAVTWTNAHIALGRALIYKAEATSKPDDLVAAANALRNAVSDVAQHPSAADRARIEYLFEQTLVAISERLD
jgi:hypothetical protein